jgi:hypothetical protein
VRIAVSSIIAMSLVGGTASAAAHQDGARASPTPTTAVDRHDVGEQNATTRKRFQVRLRRMSVVRRVGAIVAFVSIDNSALQPPPGLRVQLHASGPGFRLVTTSHTGYGTNLGRITFRLRLPARAAGEVAALRVTRAADNSYYAARSAAIRVRIR